MGQRGEDDRMPKPADPSHIMQVGMGFWGEVMPLAGQASAGIAYK
jgi:hypothetical protein